MRLVSEGIPLERSTEIRLHVGDRLESSSCPSLLPSLPWGKGRNRESRAYPYDAADSVVIREKAGAALSHLTRLLDEHLRDAKTPDRRAMRAFRQRLVLSFQDLLSG